jgi:hypothetical protein
MHACFRNMVWPASLLCVIAATARCRRIGRWRRTLAAAAAVGAMAQGTSDSGRYVVELHGSCSRRPGGQEATVGMAAAGQSRGPDGGRQIFATRPLPGMPFKFLMMSVSKCSTSRSGWWLEGGTAVAVASVGEGGADEAGAAVGAVNGVGGGSSCAPWWRFLSEKLHWSKCAAPGPLGSGLHNQKLLALSACVCVCVLLSLITTHGRQVRSCERLFLCFVCV